MLIFQRDNEHIILLKRILNEQNNKMKYLKYNDIINYKDIFDIKEEYFEDYSKNSFILEKGITYIIYLNYKINEQVHLTINPTEIVEDIPFINDLNYFYLKKDKTVIFELPDSISD